MVFDLWLFEIFVFLFVCLAMVWNEILIGPPIALVALFVVGWLFNHVDFSTSLVYIETHPVQISLYVLGYLAIGVAWSFLKWTLLMREAVRIFEESPISLTSFEYSQRLRIETNLKFPIKVSENKNRIVTWMAYWWASIPITVLGDWVINIFNHLYNYLWKIYQKITDHFISDINNTWTK